VSDLWMAPASRQPRQARLPLIEDLEKSAKLDGYSLDEAVRYLVETVEVAKKEPQHKRT
jgi:hypothetical protein